MHFLRVANNIRATFSSRKCKTEVDFEKLQQKFSPAYHNLRVYNFFFFFFLSLVQSSFHSCAETNWWIKSGKERRLSQLGSTAIISCGKYRQVRLGLSDNSTMERQLIQNVENLFRFLISKSNFSLPLLPLHSFYIHARYAWFHKLANHVKEL